MKALLVLSIMTCASLVGNAFASEAPSTESNHDDTSGMLQVRSCVDKLGIRELSVKQGNVTIGDDDVEVAITLILKRATLIYSNAKISVSGATSTVIVPFHEEFINGASCDVVTLSIRYKKDMLKKSVRGDDELIVALSGNVAENLGKGIPGQSSTFYRVIDLRSVALWRMNIGGGR